MYRQVPGDLVNVSLRGQDSFGFGFDIISDDAGIYVGEIFDGSIADHDVIQTGIAEIDIVLDRLRLMSSVIKR